MIPLLSLTKATKYTHLALIPSIPLCQNGIGGSQKGLCGPPAALSLLGVGAGFTYRSRGKTRDSRTLEPYVFLVAE